eukprot:CAMPEP_0115858708 /NCGR_PEP_ID=MMETSP0287-20121206/16238_1 /TAXON_ID=412157 /ORGANISM="Chrysochromulina rotalis, Strain UIO044" /LENGTH=277 /DNA_ID=CAMNT_0003312983 /DNA_START=98 /DNA_END=931 /DNA_ORIENTATION=+
MTEVCVTVPDGVYEGDEFTLEYEGTMLTVVCPNDCGPGDAINLQIDVPAKQQNTVLIIIPDGCYPGDEFTVDFDGKSFSIGVPDGCEPGMEISVEVPSDDSGMVVTDAMFEEAFKKASRMGNKPDVDILRWCLNTYCEHGGDIRATFQAMGDDPGEALMKPTYCDTPEKFAANYTLGYFKVRAGSSSNSRSASKPRMVVTHTMYDEAFNKASRMGTKPDADILRWCLNTYCEHGGDIRATFRAMGDDPGEALMKPTYCDTPEKFAANYVLGYFKVRR